jgi:hypothetical protein
MDDRDTHQLLVLDVLQNVVEQISRTVCYRSGFPAIAGRPPGPSPIVPRLTRAVGTRHI